MMSSDGGWWLCPNGTCPHGSILHDIKDWDDPSPTCCVEGCDCGKPAQVLIPFAPPDPNDRQVWDVDAGTDIYWAYEEEDGFVSYSWTEGQALREWFFDRRSHR